MGRAGRRHRGEQPGQFGRRGHQRLRPGVREGALRVGERRAGGPLVARHVGCAGPRAAPAGGAEAGAEGAVDGASEVNAWAWLATSARSGRSCAPSAGCAVSVASYRASSAVLSRAAFFRNRSAAAERSAASGAGRASSAHPVSSAAPPRAAPANRVVLRVSASFGTLHFPGSSVVITAGERIRDDPPNRQYPAGTDRL
ncbi:hypothetical protein SALB_06704 [Streptomyces noursei]|uniref:Uncharacterized protein n=1 Tax=Streptomyces noursei TaxID=1971 RepID=A0A401R8J6_STRNR|nr:hypothetical protein SALB_06704 [Streptomyces noursei]